MAASCGCVGDCCGICEHAKAAGRVRLLSRDVARAWPPPGLDGTPGLNQLKGQDKREQREADNSIPVIWYWQMEGKRWSLNGRMFNVASRAWHRLAATDDLRAEETAKRYARGVAEQQQLEEQERQEIEEERQAELRAEHEKQQQAETERAEKRTRQWRELCMVLRRCGLERLTNCASLQHASLYEPPVACSVRGEVRVGLDAAVTAFLNREDGAHIDGAESAAASDIAALGVSREEAVALHHALNLVRFERFVTAAQEALEQQHDDASAVALDVEMLDLGQREQEPLQMHVCFDALYAVCARETDGSWRRDLDVASQLGAMWAGDAPSGELQLQRLFRQSQLRSTARPFLQLAHARYCFRAVLLETLSLPTACTGYSQMFKLLQSSKLCVSEGEFKALVWFIGQLEYNCHGRLWARTERGYLTAPRNLCLLARGSPPRVSLLANVFGHSVVLREPLRRFLDAHLPDFVAKAWLHPRGWMHESAYLHGTVCIGAHEQGDGGVDSFMRKACIILSGVAIEKGFIGSEHLSTALLVALRSVSSADARHVRAALCTALQVKIARPCMHDIGWCNSCRQVTESLRLDLDGWDPIRQNGVRNAGYLERAMTPQLSRLQDMCMDAMRLRLMQQLSLCPADVTLPPGAWWTADDATRQAAGQILDARRSVTDLLAGQISAHLNAHCSLHTKLCRGPLDRCGRGHVLQVQACPDDAIAYLAEAVGPYLYEPTVATPRAPTPPPPPYDTSSSSEDEGMDDYQTRSYWDRERSKQQRKEKREARLCKRVWQPFAFP